MGFLFVARGTERSGCFAGEGGRREGDADAEAGCDFGVDPDLSAVLFDDLSDGGEADAAAGGLGAAFVACEDAFALVVWDATTPVTNLDFTACTDERCADADTGDRARDGVLEGVIHEVLEDADERFVFSERSGQRVDVEACAGGGELGGEADANVADDTVQFDDFAAGVGRLGVISAVSAEGGFDEGLCASGGVDGALERTACLGGEWAVGALVDEFDVGADGDER